MTPQDIVEILLVEDNLDDIELTLHTFNENNIANRIQVVRDGAEALEFLFCMGAYAHRNPHNNPRLVLLDLKLPKLDGIEVLREIKADPRTRAIPVVVLTSSHEERDLVETYQLGVNSYLVKPVNFNQLADVVRQLGHYWLILNKTPVL